MNKNNREKDFVVEYQFLPSEQSEIKLQRGFQIIFEKVIETEKYIQTNQKHLSMAAQ